MCSMKLEITARHRNLFLQMICSILKKNDYYGGSVQSMPYTIGDCVQIRLKFTYSCTNGLRASISYMSTQKDPTIKTYITCSTGVHYGCVTSYLCDNYWSDFKDINDNKDFHSQRMDNVFLYLMEAKFRVQCTETPVCNILYNDDSFTDFCLSPENGNGVQVHKAVLAAHSEVFKTMLNGEWKETAKDCLEVKGATEKTLQQLKEFMYLGALPDGTDLQTLIVIAKCYMMNRLEKDCAVKLARTVTAEGYPDLVKFAAENRLAGLFTAILENSSDETINAVGVLKKSETKDE